MPVTQRSGNSRLSDIEQRDRQRTSPMYELLDSYIRVTYRINRQLVSREASRIGDSQKRTGLDEKGRVSRDRDLFIDDGELTNAPDLFISIELRAYYYPLSSFAVSPLHRAAIDCHFASGCL